MVEHPLGHPRADMLLELLAYDGKLPEVAVVLRNFPLPRGKAVDEAPYLAEYLRGDIRLVYRLVVERDAARPVLLEPLDAVPLMLVPRAHLVWGYGLEPFQVVPAPPVSQVEVEHLADGVLVRHDIPGKVRPPDLEDIAIGVLACKEPVGDVRMAEYLAAYGVYGRIPEAGRQVHPVMDGGILLCGLGLGTHGDGAGLDAVLEYALCGLLVPGTMVEYHLLCPLMQRGGGLLADNPYLAGAEGYVGVEVEAVGPSQAVGDYQPVVACPLRRLDELPLLHKATVDGSIDGVPPACPCLLPVYRVQERQDPLEPLPVPAVPEVEGVAHRHVALDDAVPELPGGMQAVGKVEAAPRDAPAVVVPCLEVLEVAGGPVVEAEGTPLGRRPLAELLPHPLLHLCIVRAGGRGRGRCGHFGLRPLARLWDSALCFANRAKTR